MTHEVKLSIPKIIHYCWFGKSSMPEEHQAFIRHWKELLPDYAFMFWTEANSRMDIPYMRNANRLRNWANMSNFMRLQAVFEHGGIYLNTNMELVKRLEPLHADSCFFGFENARDETRLVVHNAIFGASPGHPFIRECKTYLLSNFSGDEGPGESSSGLVTWLLRQNGLLDYRQQKVDGVTLYERDYFYPYDAQGSFSIDCVTERTFTIRHSNKPDIQTVTKKIKSRKNAFSKRIISKISFAYSIYSEFGSEGMNLLREGIVRNGPFQGMKFRARSPRKSTLFPKLIGCYEETLHAAIHEIMDNRYEKILNIGCGDGYYSTGLARLFSDAIVHAYDLNSGQLQWAKRNAEANQLQNRIITSSELYDVSTLEKEDFQKRTLIFCDAEGYELELFTEKTVPLLRNVDLIIELHDFLTPGTQIRILRLFESTHNPTIYREKDIPSTTKHFLAQTRDTRKVMGLFNENRPERMSWVLLRSKQRT